MKKRYISASIQDSDEIPTAIPTFSGLGNKMGLVTTLCDEIAFLFRLQAEIKVLPV